MLLINQTSNHVAVNEPVLRTAYQRYLSAIEILLDRFKGDLEKGIEMPKEQMHKIFTKQVQGKFEIGILSLDNISREIINILEQDSVIDGTNKLFGAIIAESIETNQPPHHLERMMDLLGKRYVASDKKGDADVSDALQILESLTKAMTTGAPTTATKASFNGATIEELKFMADTVKEFQGVLVNTVGVLFADLRPQAKTSDPAFDLDGCH